MELLALKALARVHLSRVREPDAPVAALNEATKARPFISQRAFKRSDEKKRTSNDIE